MKKNTLENLFEDLKNEFDVEVPKDGHELRFLSKLKGEQTKVVKLRPSKLRSWKPYIAVAASVILCLSIFLVTQRAPEIKDLANVSPEMSETQEFFTTVLNQELVTLNNERSPETETMINDAMKRIDFLEKEYESLRADLTESGDDKRVIYAMITNFQNRIELLQNVLNQIEQVKQLKQNNNESEVTI